MKEFVGDAGGVNDILICNGESKDVVAGHTQSQVKEFIGEGVR